MDFYPPELTERSRSVLHRVHDTVPESVLIGGWATWVRTGGPMSHDIDLIVTRPQLEMIRPLVDDMSESHHLGGRKWRATLDGIHLDLYVPYDSRLGQLLELRTEVLLENREQVNDWVVLTLAAHLATKLAALLDRPDSLPGEKDRQEILALLDLGVDPNEGVRVVHDASNRTPGEVDQHLNDAFQYLGDLTLDQTQRRGLRTLASDWAAASRQLLGPSSLDRDTTGREPPTRPPGPTLGR
jgi:hypothetical protein